MDKVRALEIISHLLDGVNPFSGEIFPSDSVYNHVDVIRALHFAVVALQSDADLKITNAKRPWTEDDYKESHDTSKLPNRVGEQWTQEEDDKLLFEYNKGLSIGELSQIHQRKKGGIRARLRRNGIIPRLNGSIGIASEPIENPSNVNTNT